MGIPTRQADNGKTTDDEADVPEIDLEDEVLEPAGSWAPLVAGVVPLGFGIVMLLGSLSLGLGSPTAPQPGLWPFGLSIILIGLSLGLLIGRGKFGPCEAFGRGTLLVVAGAITIAVFIVLLPIVGFEIPAMVLAAFWLKVLGHESWRVVVTLPIIVTAVFYLLFVVLLGVAIPHLISF